jgi:hypothetical protein
MTDEPTQAEKRAVLRNDQRVAAYADVVDLYDDTRPHGRFAVGARQPVTQIPRQPSTSPWSGIPALNGPEPLGHSIEAMESVGSPAEIEASIKRLETAATPTPVPCAASAAPVAPASPPFVRRV